MNTNSNTRASPGFFNSWTVSKRCYFSLVSSSPNQFESITNIGYFLWRSWREKLRQDVEDEQPPVVIPSRETDPIVDLQGFEMVDVRSQSRTFRKKQDVQRKKKGKGPLSRKRNIDVVRGATLHQAAALISRPETAARVHCHDMVLTDARVARVADLEDRLSAANGLNTNSFSVEVACRAAGIKGDLRTFWRPRSKPNIQPTEATDEQIEVTRNLLVDRFAELRDKRQAAGLPDVQFFVWAHRQSSKQKPSDPGSRIWKGVVPWACRELDLKVGDYNGRKKGLSIPTAWGGPAGVRYNWKVRGW